MSTTREANGAAKPRTRSSPLARIRFNDRACDGPDGARNRPPAAAPAPRRFVEPGALKGARARGRGREVARRRHARDGLRDRIGTTGL